MGESIYRTKIDLVNFINIFEQASSKLNIDLSGVSLSKVLKGKDPNKMIPFSAESKSASLLFKVVEWDCVPLLDLLKNHGVRFDRVSESTDLLEHAIMKNSFDSLQWLFQCEELFDPSNDEEELNRRLSIAVELISCSMMTHALARNLPLNKSSIW